MIFIVGLAIASVADVRWRWLAAGVLGVEQATNVNQVGTFLLFRIDAGDPPANAEELIVYDANDVSNYALGRYHAEADVPSADDTAAATAAQIIADHGSGSYVRNTEPDNADIVTIKAKTDNLPSNPAATGDAMTLTTGERTAIAVEVEGHLLDEGDSQMLINAIVTAIGNTNLDEASVVAAIRADLERTGGTLKLIFAKTDNLPADPAAVEDIPSAADTAAATATQITSDHGAGSYVRNIEPDNASIAAIKAKTDNLPSDPVAVGDIPSAAETAAATWLVTDLGDLPDHSAGKILSKVDEVGAPDEPVIVLPLPELDNQAIGYVTTRDGTGAKQGGVTLHFELVSAPGDDSYLTEKFDLVSEADAEAELFAVAKGPFRRGARYKGWRGAPGRNGSRREVYFTVDEEGAQFALPQILGSP
jgi:hypothetical protein